MSSTKIKLCGMRRMQDIAAVNDLKPDFIGFIFWAPSHRYVTPTEAMQMKTALDPSIKAVGVFVDAPVDLVAKLLNDDVIDMAQLHGHEDNVYIEQLRQCSVKPVIQAFKVKTPADLDRAACSTADHLLLDSGTGSGEAFDWSLVKDFHKPFFLAGGLHPDNVQAAMHQVQPWAVDVSSGIETDKFKDIEKVRAFVNNVRNAK